MADSFQPPNNPAQSDANPSTKYADYIVKFSKLRTGVGQNFYRLANFLSSETEYPQDYFLTLHRLYSNSKDRPSTDHITHIKSIADFEALGKDNMQKHNQILFLKGYPSAQWLNTIGAKYQIDPEFFRQHLDFLCSSDPSSKLDAMPLLSSSKATMASFYITTTQSLDTLQDQHVSFEKKRKACEAAMDSYRDRLIIRQNVGVGDPIVRFYSLIDANYSVIEQRVSVYLHKHEEKQKLSKADKQKFSKQDMQKLTMEETQNNWTLLIWIDSSKDLRQLRSMPWETLQTKRTDSDQHTLSDANNLKRRQTAAQMLPIINYRFKLALKARLIEKELPQEVLANEYPPQSASTLFLNYGRSESPEIMASCPIYALRELMELVVQSELQFLSLCSTRLSAIEALGYSPDIDSLPNMKDLKRLLYRHIHQNQNMSTFITNASRLWPTPSSTENEHAEIADTAVNYLKQDFNTVIDRNQALYKRCTEAIGVLMNEIVIAESRGAMVQATRLGKLTFLAFVFVPLSFTTSFFGMNLKELGAGPNSLSIWSWFALTFPLVVAVMIVFRWEMAQIVKFITSPFRKILAMVERNVPKSNDIEL